MHIFSYQSDFFKYMYVDFFTGKFLYKEFRKLYIAWEGSGCGSESGEKFLDPARTGSATLVESIQIPSACKHWGVKTPQRLQASI